MTGGIRRREFLQTTAASALLFGLGGSAAFGASPGATRLVSPGCRGSKVRVAKIYIANPEGLWPKPNLDLKAERGMYEREFNKLRSELYDVDFTVSELITSPDQVGKIKEKLKEVDGILVIHLTLRIMPVLEAILALDRPTVVFSAPYSGHDWVYFGDLRKQALGSKLECMLTADYSQLAVAVRPFRAIHHLREAKILNVTATAMDPDYVGAVRNKFGTGIVPIDRQRVVDAYNAVPDDAAEKEAGRWISGAKEVVEPSRQEISKSARLALAFEKILDDEAATVITVDCYGTMYGKLPAFPCIGFTRLNDMGLGGICESDLQSAMTHIIFQGLSGKPGFISDPTFDEADSAVILAHCLGSTKMDGPDGEAAPYRIRTIMERQAGAVTQVRMRVGQPVTQAVLIGADRLLYFTGEITDTPDIDRGCRTKITVRPDGDIEKLWQNWSGGLHRVTCYGDLSSDLERFCRFKGIDLINEA